MTNSGGDLGLRRSAVGGFRRADVEILVARLRAENERLARRVEEAWRRLQVLEADLATTRSDNDALRAREQAALAHASELEAAAEARALRMLAEAGEGAARLHEDAAARTEQLAAQVDELVRVKESLMESIRDVLRDFGYVVERIDRGERVLADEPAAGKPARTTRAAAPPAGEDEPEPVFDARVEIEAGPFIDFATLSAFERALTLLPRVEDVYVRRFAADRAVIELTLAEPAPLLQALERALPYDIDVTAYEHGRISLDIVSFAAVEGR
jgi:hypothetical protein